MPGSSRSLELDTEVTVLALRRLLVEKCPELRDFLERSAITVGNEYAFDETLLSSYTEIAILPPVIGGLFSQA